MTDNNPYSAPQTREHQAARRFATVQWVLVPVLVMLTAYALFRILWATPFPV